MTNRYILPCTCGKSVVINTTQAGQMITCNCGNSLTVPSLLRIKSLETAPEVGISVSKNDVSKKETGFMRRAFFMLGLILLVPSFLFLLYSLNTYPKPLDVSQKRVFYTFGNSELYRDSTPIPDKEHEILRMREEYIDLMNPMELYFYFLTLKNSGPNFSFNFQDNFQLLKDAYQIRVVTGLVFSILAIGFIIASFFMPNKNVIITGWSGTDWH